MRGWCLAAVALAIGSGCAVDRTTGGTPAGAGNYVVTPHLDVALAPATNYLYCPVVQLAWDQSRKEVGGGPLELAGNPPLARALNAGRYPVADLEPDGYFAAAGFLGSEAPAKAAAAFRARFGQDNARLQELARRRRAPGRDLVLFASLPVNLQFDPGFEDLGRPLRFASGGATSDVQAFGVLGRDLSGEQASLRALVHVYDYRGDDDFVIGLRANYRGQRAANTLVAHELVLARIVPGATLAETWQRAAARLKQDRENGRLTTADSLAVPILSVQGNDEFPELLGRRVLNPGHPKARLVQACQQLEFRLQGGGTASPAAGASPVADVRVLEPPPREFACTGPFLLALRRGQGAPYLVLWVANARVMAAWRPPSPDYADPYAQGQADAAKDSGARQLGLKRPDPLQGNAQALLCALLREHHSLAVQPGPPLAREALAAYLSGYNGAMLKAIGQQLGADVLERLETRVRTLTSAYGHAKPVSFLRAAQNADGSWGRDPAVQPALTAVALLALVQHGKTPLPERAGGAGAAAAAASAYLIAVNETYQRTPATPPDTEALLALALAETGNLAKTTPAKAAATAAASRLLTQGIARDNLWDLLALNSLRLQGLGDATALEQAVADLRATLAQPPREPQRLAAYLLASSLFAKAPDAEALGAALAAAKAAPTWTTAGSARPLDDYLTWTLAQCRRRGSALKTWHAALGRELAGALGADGQVPVGDAAYELPPGLTPDDALVYSTALAAMALDVYYRYLPFLPVADPSQETP